LQILAYVFALFLKHTLRGREYHQRERHQLLARVGKLHFVNFVANFNGAVDLMLEGIKFGRNIVSGNCLAKDTADHADFPPQAMLRPCVTNTHSTE
jgi:hypothetical protein